MSGQLRTRYDIVINGGGIVGFTLLNLIQKSPYLGRCKVLLIEQAAKPQSLLQTPRGEGDDKIYSNRVSSITYSSKLAFKRLGVWDKIKPYAKDVRRIKVWNYLYHHNITFKQDLPSCCDDKEERDIVFSTVENNRLSTALLDNIYQISNGESKIAWSSELVNIEESLENGAVDVLLQGDKELKVAGSLILGCDGYKSKIRELVGMKYTECDLEKCAVVGTVKMSKLVNSNNDIAYQKFSVEKDTVVALLPLDNEFSSFVISGPEGYARHLAECTKETFLSEVNSLLATSEAAPNPFLRGLHEVANSSYDNVKILLQMLGPRLGISPTRFNYDVGGPGEAPSIEYVVANSRASFPLKFGTTSPRMVSSLPGLNRPQIVILGDASHRIHPLAGQGLNLGIQDAVELVGQLEKLAKTGERLFNDTSLLVKALKKYELRRQIYIMPMSAGLLGMQDLFKLAPSRLISSVDGCQPFKTACVRVANGF